jgi:hypothetical protein
MRKYQGLLAKHRENGVKIPVTASYEHTVRRVISMTRKQLEARVKAIERAAGMYAVVKMRMFAEVKADYFAVACCMISQALFLLLAGVDT